MNESKSAWLFGTMLIYSVAMPAAVITPPAPPRPGMLNSFTGEVWMNGVPAGQFSAGRATLEIGQAIKTGQGMAELLLSPGSFVRLGKQSELTLEVVSTLELRVRLGNGEALMEVLNSQTPLFLEQNGVTAVVRNPGLYDFDEKRGVMAVFAGEAQLSKGDRQIVVPKGFGVRTRSLREFQTKPRADSSVFSWSSRRSQLLSAESAASAQIYPAGTGTWHGLAWYWNPWSASYPYLSASGAVTGPFGWPYYSPSYAPNQIPARPGGDAGLYGPPVLTSPPPTVATPSGPVSVTPTVPLTAPGVPQFPNNK